MIPSAFVNMEALPLTPSGKVDRKALPAPGGQRPDLAQTYAPPATDMERLLARVWSQALSIERVGAEDNYFELGGNSFLSIQIAARLREELRRDLAVVTLFQYPTVRSLAAHLDGAAEQNAAAGRSPANGALDKAQERAMLQRQAASRRRR